MTDRQRIDIGTRVVFWTPDGGLKTGFMATTLETWESFAEIATDEGRLVMIRAQDISIGQRDADGTITFRSNA